jgi:hypothetical protein
MPLSISNRNSEPRARDCDCLGRRDRELIGEISICNGPFDFLVIHESPSLRPRDRDRAIISASINNKAKLSLSTLSSLFYDLLNQCCSILLVGHRQPNEFS